MISPTSELYFENPRSLVRGNSVRLLRDGAEVFPAWLSAIDAARVRISLEMYIFSDDQIGRRVAEALCRAAERGVEVRVLYDDIGCRLTPRAFFSEMRARGVKTIAYHRSRGWRPKIWKLFRRNHRKALTIDRTQTFVGGLNISNEWVPAKEGGEDWRDAVVEIRGPSARDVEAAFAVVWNRRARVQSRLVLEAEGVSSASGGASIAVITNAERGERFAIRRSCLHAIRAANERVLLATPYFVPDRGIQRALESAAARGCRVCILVPSDSDSQILDAAARATFPRLLAAGVKIWRSPAVIHTKAIAVDRSFVSLGSYNLDHRSLAFNLEIVANVMDAKFNEDVAAMLESEIVAATEVSLAMLMARPALWRLADRIAHSFRQWL